MWRTIDWHATDATGARIANFSVLTRVHPTACRLIWAFRPAKLAPIPISNFN
jgi:hypothetical protein